MKPIYFIILTILLYSCNGQKNTDSNNDSQVSKSNEGAYLYALDFETGKEIWKYKTDEVATGASSDLKSVYFGGGNSFYSVQKDNGELQWKVELDSRIGCTPISDSAYVYFFSENGIIYSYEKKTHKEVWSINTESSIINFSIGENSIYAPYKSKYLISINKETGIINWQFNSIKSPINKALEYQNKVIFSSDNNMMYCLNKNNGELLWEWDAKKTSPASPVLYDNKIYLGHLANHIFCINPDIGSIDWKYQTTGSVLSNPTIENSILYFGANNKTFIALSLKTDEIIWEYKTDYWIMSEAKIVDNRIYFGGAGGNIYCLNKTSGDLIWKYQTNGPLDITNPILIDGKVLYSGSKDGFKVMMEGNEYDMRTIYSN
ncbi:hypothetical protein BZG01_10365 [Labilibaculum manganireducens]|uniref:Pyrrolo-quinoline quinone repeat domain-containing protein n=1 Tax=Labilibaculum manganireducens TaxID=1940525 RepID=A0A2N3I8M1_9BACT|nr:PQQ-binding-like beta-propeller repeat protein [Labilibaculum manganireducens]PKQ66671.1 hypothetical protein BZG01_10365 [Labilibaculum manganireducens]